jgi:uncharacterized membrane protein
MEEKKDLKQTINTINLWNMILAWSADVLAIIYLVVIAGQGLTASTNADGSLSNASTAGIVGSTLVFFLLLMAVGIAGFVISIRSAVKINGKEGKKFFTNSGAVPVLAILQIFLFREILSTVVYFMAKSSMKNND